MASKDVEVEFSGSKQKVRVKPVNWNESTLSLKAAGKDDFISFFIGEGSRVYGEKIHIVFSYRYTYVIYI